MFCPTTQGMMLIQAQNAVGFGQYLAEHGNTICGRHPIAVRVCLTGVVILCAADGEYTVLTWAQT